LSPARFFFAPAERFEPVSARSPHPPSGLKAPIFRTTIELGRERGWPPTGRVEMCERQNQIAELSAGQPSGCGCRGRRRPASTLLACIALVASLMTAGRPAAADSLKLTLGASTFSFPDADPDLVPSIAANENPIAITVRYSGNG